MLKDISAKEYQAILFSSICVMAYFLMSNVFVLYNFYNFTRQFVYLVTISILPLFLVFLRSKFLRKTEQNIPGIGRWIFVVNLITIGLLSISFPPYSYEYCWAVLFIFLFSIFLLFLFKKETRFLIDFLFGNPLFNKIVATLIAVVSSLFIVNSVYGWIIVDSYELLIKMYPQIKSIALILTGLCVFSFALTTQVFCFEKRSPFKFYKYYTLGICFLPVLLFDIANTFDIEHYNAYLGPAIAVLHGKIPLVDVFSHYGLSYLIFTLAFLFSPNNYGIAGAVVSGLNVVQLIFLMLILRRFIKNPTFFLMIGISFLFGLYYFTFHSPNITPSAMGIRYLPSIILLYQLICRLLDDNKNKVNIKPLSLENLLLAFNSLWSLESLVFSLGIYVSYFWLICGSMRGFFRKIFELSMIVSGAYVLLTMFYLVFYGESPNYLFYFKYIYNYLNPNSGIGRLFLLVNVNTLTKYFYWIPVAVFHVMGIFYFISHRVFDFSDNREVKAMLLLNSASVLFMVYYVLQPSVFSFLICSMLSVIFCILSLLFIRNNSDYYPVKFFANTSLIFINSIFIFVFICSMNAYPVSSSSSGSLLNLLMNDSRNLFDKFSYNLHNFCSNKNVDKTVREKIAITENTCKRYSFHDEMYCTINKWYKNEKEILLFHRSFVEVLVENNKIHKFLVNPFNDDQVPELGAMMIERSKKLTKIGDVLIVDKDLNVSKLEYSILKSLASQYSFKNVEKTRHLNVFVLQDKSIETDLNFPINPTYSESSFVMGNENFLTKELFDNDKGSVWAIAENFKFDDDYFWFLVDLGENHLVKDLKIWRRIDFRVPDYYSEKNLAFIKDFNIESSEDGENWTMISSEKNYELGGGDFYGASFNNLKARYLKVNIFSDSDRKFNEYVSEFEVYGTPVVSGGA